MLGFLILFCARSVLAARNESLYNATHHVPVNSSAEENLVMAKQVESVIQNAVTSGDTSQSTVVGMVLAAMNSNATANCSSSDFRTCAKGYFALDCVFSAAAAQVGTVNCVPYLSQCTQELKASCIAQVSPADRCKAKTACDCSSEIGCGWNSVMQLCLVGRPAVNCGDCSTMAQCGLVDCLKATRPCDCVMLGGMCGWSTSTWRCQAGKQTDCNECPLQTECGGPGVSQKDSTNCPAQVPPQLSSCNETLQCTYNKTCCSRCLGQKQVCASTQASCQNKDWVVQKGVLECPDCEGYYYDYSSSDVATPSEPLNLKATSITTTSAVLKWAAPQSNFKSGVDFYSLAYSLDSTSSSDDDVVLIPDYPTQPTYTLTGLKPGTSYKVNVLPVNSETETGGTSALLTFTTLAPPTPASKGKAGKASAKGKAKGKATAPTVAKGKATKG